MKKPINEIAFSLKLSRNAMAAAKVIREIKAINPKLSNDFLRTYIKFLKQQVNNV